MGNWQPTTIRRFERALPTSACTAIVETDAGKAYLKGLGGPEGPHTLVCEWVATHLARWFGLPTFDVAIIEVTEADEIPFVDKNGEHIGQAQPGPAFVSRAEFGEPWSGKQRQLERLANPEAISRLVVFDTWTLNCDRYSRSTSDPLGKPRVNRSNVFLSGEAPRGRFLLKAMDHTHCFTCGRALTTSLATIDRIRDVRVFGRFPEFGPLLDRAAVEAAVADLRRIETPVVQEATHQLPREWETPANVVGALEQLVLNRASFVADTIADKLWPQRELGFEEPERET